MTMLGTMSNVLVLLAPYGSEKPSTSQFVSQLQAAGACILKTQAKAEVSLTRNVLAGSACDALRALPDLQWVFWLDQDISGTVGNVLQLIELSSHIMQLGQGIGYPSMSGLYVNRYTSPARLACHALRGMDRLRIDDMGEHPLDCVPALCGLGCFLQHRSVFLAHCDESPHFLFPTRDTIVPEVCSSHRIHSSELAKYLPVDPDLDAYWWQSEDFDYCAREFEQGRLVFAAPVGFGHECDHILWPDENATFPGLRPPHA
jgi:hypothetical protein